MYDDIRSWDCCYRRWLGYIEGWIGYWEAYGDRILPEFVHDEERYMEGNHPYTHYHKYKCPMCIAENQPWAKYSLGSLHSCDDCFMDKFQVKK